MSGRSRPSPFYVNSSSLTAQGLTSAYATANYPPSAIRCGDTNQMALYFHPSGSAAASYEWMLLFSRDGVNFAPEQTESTSGSTVTHTAAEHTMVCSAITIGGSTLSAAAVHVPTGTFEYVKLALKCTTPLSTTAMAVYYELGDQR